MVEMHVLQDVPPLLQSTSNFVENILKPDNIQLHANQVSIYSENEQDDALEDLKNKVKIWMQRSITQFGKECNYYLSRTEIV